MSSTDLLPSWREGSTRSTLLAFIEQADTIPAERRVAVFDNDGTLWCEKPNYTQLDFFVAELRGALEEKPELAERPEYAAILKGNRSAMAELGLERVAFALVELFVGLTPEEFDQRVREFIMNTEHPELGAPYAKIIYQPMLELLELLGAHSFSTFIVSGGGTEFVRAISRQLYGVDPEGVVGSLVAYEYIRRDGVPALIRKAELQGAANEGPAKVEHIQSFLGRRPIFAAGNSAGDAEMMEYAAANDPGLALLVNHDDGDREYSYESKAGTFAAAEAILETASRLGWTVVSMQEDWTQVFSTPAEGPRTSS